MRIMVVASLLFLAACEKDIMELPPATQTGAHTFGCRIDGAFWVPEGFGIVPTAPLLEARFIDDHIKINARYFATSPTESEFEIYLKDVVAPGVYPLNKNVAIYPNQSESYGYFVKRRFRPTAIYLTNERYTGSVTITRVDKPNKIVSGTFAFRAENVDVPGTYITVSEGRFDIKMI